MTSESRELRIARARDLRQSQTDAEALLWYHLRSRQLVGAKFRRQHPAGPYFLDFYCKEHRLCVEVDGTQHHEPEPHEHDSERTAYLTSQGIRVLRFDNAQVIGDVEAVLSRVLAALNHPHPTLSLSEGGLSESKSDAKVHQQTKAIRQVQSTE
jgi:adenine-specific DNA-methyltransferase